jgi:hypothetical protein
VIEMDEDAIKACADLAGRTGAKEFQIGYLHDDVPADEAGWYAHIKLKGTRITVEAKAGPVEAADALAEKILTGGQCFHCKKLVALSPKGAVAFDGHLADGTPWTVAAARKAGQCLWTRVGPRWVRGCEETGHA